MTVQNVSPTRLLLTSYGPFCRAVQHTHMQSCNLVTNMLRCMYHLVRCGKDPLYCMFADPSGDALYNLPHRISCRSPGSSIKHSQLTFCSQNASCFLLKLMLYPTGHLFWKESKAKACSGGGFRSMDKHLAGWVSL